MIRGRLACLFLALLLLAPEAGTQEVKLKTSLQLPITHPLVGVRLPGSRRSWNVGPTRPSL
jgi:hypothetical protein